MLIQIKDFAGLAPKVSDRSLPDNYASGANNSQLYSGELRGLKEPLCAADLTDEPVGTIQRAYRLYDGSTSIEDTVGTWVAFDDADVNFIRGALTNDSFDRYYASGGSQAPTVATATAWDAGTPLYDLGVPAPTTAPGVTPPASSTTDETRAYVYTFVNEWGEESAPSPPSDPATGSATGTWQLSGMDIAFTGGLTPNPLDKIRVYRTVTGLTSVDYRFVAEIDPPAATYNDSETPDDVSLNESLPSSGWDLPPSTLEGIVNMPNGIMVGFSGRDLYFSEPYRPHAWPTEYIVSVDAQIIGLGVYQSGVVVCTTANPYVATGSHPQSIILTRLDDVEPCQSFRSIVSSIDGVMYASQNGIIIVNQAGARNVTQPLITRNEWRSEFAPDSSRIAVDGSRLLAFTSASVGWLFQPLESLGYMVKLNGFVDVTGVQTDPFTGEAYIISRDCVFVWNPSSTSPQSYEWVSKEFETPYPVNMGAYRLQYEDVITGGDFTPGIDYSVYNADRNTATSITLDTTNRTDLSNSFSTNPLNTLALAPINGVRTETGVVDSPPIVQFRMPLGGSPLYPNEPNIIRDSIRVRIWGDGVLRYDTEITSNDMQRLPSGYKADKWQVAFTSAQNIYSFKMAGTAKELAKA